MDPMLELARHPDILEAIGRIEHGRAIRAFDEPRDKQNGEQTDEQGEPALRKQDLIKAARDLLVMRQLATDYPNVWMTEVVHAFYKTPDVAATAWVELRYCRQFLNDLAKQLRQRADAMAIPWIGKKPSYSTQVEVAKLRKTHQQDSADDWSKALSEDHDLVDRLCIELDTLPAVPTFIRDLIADQLPSFGARDSRTRDLLAHPDKLRRCVPGTGRSWTSKDSVASGSRCRSRSSTKASSCRLARAGRLVARRRVTTATSPTGPKASAGTPRCGR